MGGQVYQLTLSIDFSFDLFVVVVALYSLKKQVCLASRGFYGLDFAI